MTEEFNPFQPPASPLDVTPSATAQELVPATRGRRFGTFVVDYIGMMLLGALVGVVLGLALGDGFFRALDKIPDIVIGTPILFAYYGFFEGRWNRTPGKWLFGTIVVNESGTQPTMGQVLGRTACRLIPFEALSVLFSCRGWHDRIPQTHVVRYVRPN